MAARLPFKNTSRTYGVIAIALHWIVALGFIINYALIYYRDWFVEKRSDLGSTLFHLHLNIGVSILVFVVLRLLWKRMNLTPDPIPASKFQQSIAKAAHVLLYTFILIIPLTGYLGTGGPSKLFFAIDLPAFKATKIFETVVQGWMGLDFKTFEAPIDFMHKQGGAYVASVLIFIHISAALYHHFIVRDATLKRMMSPRAD